MKKLLLGASVWVLMVVSMLSPVWAANDDILDFLPAILAGIKPKPSPPPIIYPPGVSVLPTWSTRTDYSGDLMIVGEIYNNSTQKIYLTKIRANVYNGSSFVYTDYTFTNIDIVLPRTKACFKMYTDYSGAYSRIAFQAPTFFNTSNRKPKLTLSNVTRTVDYAGDIQIIGMLRNSDTVAIEYPKVIGSFYNFSGKIIDCDFGFTDSTSLSPGHAEAFDIRTFTPNNSVSKFTLQTDGIL